MSSSLKLCFVHESLEETDRHFINRGVCDGLPITHLYDGNYYCVLHFPDKQKHKTTDFESVAMDRLDKQKNDFRYVYFSCAILWTKHTFQTVSSFLGATFLQTAMFSECLFDEKIIFSGVNFNKTVSFRDAVFNQETYFIGAKFLDDAFFTKTVFHEESQVFFNNASFCKGVYFSYALFKNYVAFDGLETFKVNETTVDLQNVRLSNPERVSFANINLRPSWFIEIDSRKLNFVNVEWKNIGKVSAKKNVNVELRNINLNNSKTLLKIACLQLAENAENNNRFEEASDFRRMAFECEWLEKKERFSAWLENLDSEANKFKKGFQRFVLGKSYNKEFESIFLGLLRRVFDFSSNLLYRITSGYGENPFRAFVILMGLILLIFPFIYTQTDFQVSPKAIPLEVVVLTECKDLVNESKPVCSKIRQGSLNFWNEAILHSLTTVTFQEVEYRRPLSFWAEFWTLLERIVVPVQAALLALAIRRKFMR